jgi:hypothetical protein
VADDLNHEYQIDQPHQPPLRRRSSPALAIFVVVLAFIACASAYLWLNYGDQVRSAILDTPPVGATSAPVMVGAEDTVSRADFEAFKQQTTDSLRSTIEGLDAQKTELKRLFDQVAALPAKMDMLPNPTSSMPAQASVVSVPTPVVQPRSAVIAQRKKPSAPKNLRTNIGWRRTTSTSARSSRLIAA